VLPAADGTAGQALVTNGSQALSFATVPTVPGNLVQAGTATLTAGTVTITAAITATSRILVTMKNAPAALTTLLVVPSVSRTIGSPGSFVVNGLVAALTVNSADNTSTFDWEVIG
jgi:hypothetical protein